jgi:hypothetical protein
MPIRTQHFNGSGLGGSQHSNFIPPGTTNGSLGLRNAGGFTNVRGRGEQSLSQGEGKRVTDTGAIQRLKTNRRKNKKMTQDELDERAGLVPVREVIRKKEAVRS